MIQELKCLENPGRVKPMDLLIIGAGAVGSVYGYFASKAGTRVSYFVKPKHRSVLEAGLTLHRWRGGKAETLSFREFDVIDSVDDLRTKKFDAALFTLASDRLKDEDGFEKIYPALGQARIWSLQPNATDIEWIASKMGSSAYERLVWGRIPIMSYLAPLPGEAFEKTGYAFYIPPGAKALWTSKNPSLAEEATELFSKGGLASKASEKDFRSEGIYAEAYLRMLVAALERSDWSLDRLLNGENIYLFQESVHEGAAILAKRYGTKDPSKSVIGRFMASPTGLRIVTRFAKAMIPFDIEAFLRIHFTKVEEQMHQALDELIAAGKKNGMSTTSLTLLR